MAGEAYEELAQTGDLGVHTLELLRRMGRQVARTVSFPPPEGHGQWSDEAVDDLLTEMLSQEGVNQRFVLTCFASAIDEMSLERLFLASIRNFLKDQAKSTERGKLRRRFASRLAADDAFRKVSDSSPRWVLTSHPLGSVWQGDVDDLIAIAWRVRDVGIVRWNHSGPTPAGTIRALMGVLTAVLEHAGGAVREEDLARVLEARFELLAPARFVSLHADDGGLIDPTAEAQGGVESGAVFSEAHAGEIWQNLSSHERALLPYLDLDARHASQLLEVGRAQAAAILGALRDNLRLALSDDTEQASVMRALLNRSADPPPPQ